MNTDISIIIPTKNEETFLPKLLSSIAIQTLKPAEIIVSDADSRDNTRQIARKFHCKIVTGGNHPAIGRNKGAAVAKSPVLLFLDADVILPDKDFLKKTMHEFVKRKLGVAYCLVTINSDSMIDRIAAVMINAYFVASERVIKNGAGYCTFTLKSVHKSINGFDEELVLAEDMDYVRRASKITKFRLLHSKKIRYSLRRYNEEGRITLTLKYFYSILSVIFNIRMTNRKITYSFNHSYSKENK